MLVTAPETDADDLLRLPGLFRRWELEQIVEAGNDYRIEDAGTAGDGTPLFAVYCRQPATLTRRIEPAGKEVA